MGDIGCAGILVSDTFCSPMKHIPEPGVLAKIDSITTSAGGCAANAAIDLARLGFDVDIVGCLGKDPAASALLSCLKDSNVGCTQLTYTQDYPTSRTVVLLVEGQDRRYIHTIGANNAFTVVHIKRQWLAELKVFYLGGLLALPAVKTQELLDVLKFCREKGVVTVVDVVVPQGKCNFDQIKPLLPFIDYFLPNDDEARELTGWQDVLEQLRTFLAHGANTVIITQGCEGAVAARGNQLWRCGIYKVDSIDPSGSGDAFDAGLIIGIRRGYEMPEMLRCASAVAASANRAVGTTDGVFTADELEKFVNSNHIEVTCDNLK